MQLYKNLSRVFFCFLTFFSIVQLNAQVGINTTSPSPGSILDVESTDKGILIPRVNIADLNTIAPVTGGGTESLLIYNTNNSTGKGFHYWNGSSWIAMEDLNLSKNDLTQVSGTRTYNMGGNKLGFTNGQLGVNTNNPSGSFEARSSSNHDAFYFVQEDNLTGEKDVFIVEDKDNGGGSQDHSSTFKILKSGNINSGDSGFSLLELTNTGADPGADKYWISGRKVDEGAPLWGVDVTDNDIWSSGGARLGVTPNSNGSYSSGTFIVEPDGDTGIKTTTPNGALEVNSSNSGVILPRVSLTAANVSAPVINPNGGGAPIVGTFVYNTNTTTNGPNEVTPGLYMWNGTKWVAMFNKFDYERFQQDAATVTQNPSSPNQLRTMAATVNVPGLINRRFRPKYTGVYELYISTNFGAGQINDPEEGLVSVGTQEGTFEFTCNGGVGNTFIYAHSFSSVDQSPTGTDDKRFAIWREATTTRFVNLVAGQDYTFSLRFIPEPSPRFDVTATGAGRGYIGLDIPCEVVWNFKKEN